MLWECFMNVWQKILYGELQVVERSHGSQKKRYKDTLKPPRQTSTYQQSDRTDCTDRAKWGGLIRSGACEYETKIISEAEQKRAQRKARLKASPTDLSS